MNLKNKNDNPQICGQKKGECFMKKIICSVLVSGVILSSAVSAMCAESVPTLTAAQDSGYSVVMNGKTLPLPSDTVFEQNSHVMIPVRMVAEALGFKVEWDAQNRGVRLDNGEVNTTISIGDDLYYMASSTAIGMSAPTSLGAAPVLKNGVTYAPVEIFNVLYCADAVSVKDRVITVNKDAVDTNKDNSTQIPNPFTEYKSIDEAKKALSFEPKLPTVVPTEYKIAYIATMGSDFLDVRYTNGGKEIMYRTSVGSDDISGDYNVYKNVSEVKVGDLTVTMRSDVQSSESEKLCGAVWQDGGMTYALSSDAGLSEKDIKDIISNIK